MPDTTASPTEIVDSFLVAFAAMEFAEALAGKLSGITFKATMDGDPEGKAPAGGTK